MASDSTPTSVSDDVIKSLKAVDSSISKLRNDIVPVLAGTNAPSHPASYQDRRTIPLEEKNRFSSILAGGEETVIQAPITDSDIEAIKEKAWMATLHDFDTWVLGQVQYLAQPEKKAWLKKVYPEFFDRLLEASHLRDQMKRKYLILKVDGCKSIEDAYFMFNFERCFPDAVTGETTIENYGDNLIGTDAIREAIIQQQFERGVFNTRKRWLQWGTINGPVNGMLYPQVYRKDAFDQSAQAAIRERSSRHPHDNRNEISGDMGGHNRYHSLSGDEYSRFIQYQEQLRAAQAARATQSAQQAVAT